MSIPLIRRWVLTPVSHSLHHYGFVWHLEIRKVWALHTCSSFSRWLVWILCISTGIIRPVWQSLQKRKLGFRPQVLLFWKRKKICGQVRKFWKWEQDCVSPIALHRLMHVDRAVITMTAEWHWLFIQISTPGKHFIFAYPLFHDHSRRNELISIRFDPWLKVSRGTISLIWGYTHHLENWPRLCIVRYVLYNHAIDSRLCQMTSWTNTTITYVWMLINVGLSFPLCKWRWFLGLFHPWSRMDSIISQVTVNGWLLRISSLFPIHEPSLSFWCLRKGTPQSYFLVDPVMKGWALLDFFLLICEFL